jgi:hypothetical protein
MNKRPYFTNPGGGRRAKEADQIDEQLEKHIESRSKDLENQVTALAESPFPTLLSDASSEQDLEALLVKEARLRWLVRVAKYSEGRNREALWHEAQRALVHLENTADAVLYAKCA